MNVDTIISNVIHFGSDNLVITVILGGIFILFCFKKPMQTLKITSIILFFLGVVYFASHLSDSLFLGVDKKEEIVEKQENY